MGDLNNLFKKRNANTTLPSFHKLSSATYRDFIERNEFGVVLFDAPWDVGGAKAIRPLLQSILQTYSDRVRFGEVDIDECQDVAASVRLLNIPTLGYYRGGNLTGLFIGQAQDVSARIAALLAGKKLE